MTGFTGSVAVLLVVARRDEVAGALIAAAERRGIAVRRATVDLAVDVARCADGRFVVLEANTAWAAAPYGCAPDGVLEAVLAANGGADAGRWPLPAGRWPLPGSPGDRWPVGGRS